MKPERFCWTWLVCIAVMVAFSLVMFLETGCGSSARSNTVSPTGTGGTGGTASTGGSGSGTTGGTSGGGSSGGSGTGSGSAGSNSMPHEFLYVAAGQDVWGWTINSDSSLTPVSKSPFAVGGSSVVADPKANYLFSVGGNTASTLALNTDTIAADGSLTISSTFADSTLMSGLSINPAGSALYADSISAAQQNPGWKIFTVQADGSLTFTSGTINQVSGRLIFTADGSNAYQAYCYHLGANILDYSVASNGTLTALPGQVTQIESSTECPNAVAVTPDGKMLAAPWVNADMAGAPDNRIMLYSIDPATHALSALTTIPLLASGFGNDAVFDNSGKFLVMAQSNGIGVYQVSNNSATEVPGSPFASGTNFSRVLFSPSGGSLAAISNADNQLYVFAFNNSNGTLTAGPGSPKSVTAPLDLTVTKR